MLSLVMEGGVERTVLMEHEEFKRENAHYRYRDQYGRAAHVTSCMTSNAANYVSGATAQTEEPPHVHRLQAVPIEYTDFQMRPTVQNHHCWLVSRIRTTHAC